MSEMIKRFDDAVADYLSELKNTGCSEKTVENYGKGIKYFKTFWIDNCDAESEPNVKAVRAWRDSMLEKGTSAKSVKQYMTRLKCFFTFASNEDITGEAYFSCNPVIDKIFPKLKGEDTKPYEKVLTADDFMKLYRNECPKGFPKATWIRNYAVMMLLLDAKIRNAELLNLRMCDVHFADEDDPFNYIVVTRGKGNKYREVDLNEISVSALLLYLKYGDRPQNLPEDAPLFGTTAEHKYGGKMTGAAEWHTGTADWLSKLVEGHVRRVTGKSGFRSHSMRHNGAIMELNNGTSLEQIQAELGHSNVQTTQIYAGHLQSRRHRMDMRGVFTERDAWAEKNMALVGA